MPANAGTAYIQIIPSAKGIKGKLAGLFKDEAQTAGEQSGQTLGSSLVDKIKGTIKVASIGAFLGASLNEGGALQQSLGGIETLFKENADTVKNYAKQAFNSAGVSANEYMENVTSFSASLISSLGGDTAKAAKVANMAMVDMSDNANKMGTDMESIQNAYQGFAKQNYTMLDNLKLGYGGTKQEMQRLLEDAQKLTGVKYDINNLSDVYEAIHAIQENLDITGTTAKEAATTLTGSFGAMKAAAKDFLGNLAIGADITEPMANLVKTTSTFVFGNLLPMIGNIAISLPKALITGISQAIPVVISNLGNMFSSMAAYCVSAVPGMGMQIGQSVVQAVNSIAQQLPEFVAQGKTIIDGIINGINTNAPLVLAEIQTLSFTMISNFMFNFPQFLEAGAELILYAVQGITSALPTLVENISLVATTMVDTFIARLPEFLQQGAEVIANMINGLVQTLPSLTTTFSTIIDTVISLIMTYLPEFLQQGAEVIVNMINGLVQTLPSLTATFSTIIDTVISLIMTYLPEFLNEGVQFIAQIAQGVINNLPAILGAIASMIASTIASIASNLPQFLSKGIEIIGNIIAGLLQAVPNLIGAIPGILESAASAFGQYNWSSIGSNIISGIVSGIVAAGSAIGNALMNIAKSAFSSVKKFLGIKSPSKKANKEIGQFLPQGVAQGVDEDKTLVMSMRNLGKRAIQSAKTSFNLGDLKSVAQFNVSPKKDIAGYSQSPVTNFYQTINSAKELSPYEIEIRTQAMLKRSVWA